tara:strand:- start:30 stop:1064 length:1035 start_codon:yes stop_codon:yes gene_type:complete
MELRNDVYYLDAVKIISKTPVGEIRKGLPIDKLECFCKELNTGFIRYKKRAWNFGYKSWIEFSVPEKEFFKLLNQHHLVLGKYNFTKLEIARDLLCNSESESLLKLETEIFSKYIRKYTSDYVLWNEGYAEKMKPNSNKTKEKYGDNTLYFKSRCKEKEKCKEKGYCVCNFWNFAAYVRLCKVKKFCDVPTVHAEFRLHGAEKINKYARIKEIKDALNFDPELTYIFLEEKFITKSNGINFDRLGRFIGNHSTQVPEVKKKLGKEKFYYPALQRGRLYCEINKIEYPFQLWKKIKSVKIEAKKTKGRPYPGTVRFKKLSARRFKTFFVPEGYVFKKGKLAYNKY